MLKNNSIESYDLTGIDFCKKTSFLIKKYLKSKRNKVFDSTAKQNRLTQIYWTI